MITFSVNDSQDNVYRKVDKIVELLKGMDKYSNHEYVTDAFFSIIEGKKEPEKIDLRRYSMVMEKASQLERAKSDEVHLLDFDEVMAHYKGVSMDNLVDESIYDDFESVELIGLENEFLRLRENVYALEGVDIWRLIQLEQIGSKRDSIQLKELMKEVEGYYEGAIELVTLVKNKHELYEKIYKILGD